MAFSALAFWVFFSAHAHGVKRRNTRARALTRKGVLLGSPAYMAPEQAEAKSVDQRSDLFSLGTILWESATGDRLFVGKTVLEILNAVVSAPIAAPSQARSSVPRELDAWILTALQRDPARRFQTAREMARVMLSLASPSVRDHWSAEFGAPMTIDVPVMATAATIARSGPTNDLEAVTIPLDTTTEKGESYRERGQSIPYAC